MEVVKGKPRIINYLGYPANYGMIPQTILPKELGGDGDPLDIIVLGPPVARGAIIRCSIIGALQLKDRGEQDDKLLAISVESKMAHISHLDGLSAEYPGVLDIVETWFVNYKGADKMQSEGYVGKKDANKILVAAMNEYQEMSALK